MRKLFHTRQHRINPTVVLIDGVKLDGTPNHVTGIQIGSFSLVFPNNAREVLALQMMIHHVDKFAPATGGGVIVSNNYLAMLDAR